MFDIFWNNHFIGETTNLDVRNQVDFLPSSMDQKFHYHPLFVNGQIVNFTIYYPNIDNVIHTQMDDFFQGQQGHLRILTHFKGELLNTNLEGFLTLKECKTQGYAVQRVAEYIFHFSGQLIKEPKEDNIVGAEEIKPTQLSNNVSPDDVKRLAEKIVKETLMQEVTKGLTDALLNTEISFEDKEEEKPKKKFGRKISLS